MSWTAWGWLLGAGLVEVAWTQSIKPTNNFTRLGPTVVCFVLGATSVYLLTKALDLMPTGTGYVVFTAIGSCGAILIGVLTGRETMSVLRVTGLLVIVVGVCLTHIAAGSSADTTAAGGRPDSAANSAAESSTDRV